MRKITMKRTILNALVVFSASLSFFPTVMRGVWKMYRLSKECRLSPSPIKIFSDSADDF